MKLISDRRVPHIGPEDADIFILGDCPGSTDNDIQKPFSGDAGDILEIALQDFGIDKSSVRLGNLLNYQPLKGDMMKARSSWQLEESRNELREYLKHARHKVILALGDEALQFLTGFSGIEKHRGSVYKYNNTWVIPSIHPSTIRWDGSAAPMLLHDIKKAIHIAEHGWKEHQINTIIDPDIYHIESLVPTLAQVECLTVDIETKKYTSYIRCIGFAWSDHDAVCIYNDAHYIEGQSPVGPMFRMQIQKILSLPNMKIFHNGMFDTMMLGFNDFTVENWTYDTMVAQHVLQPELPIGLDFCTSIYTDINYYKDDGKESGDRLDRKKLGLYNCKDVIATMLTYKAQQAEFDDVSRRYFEYKMKQIPLAIHFSKTGLYNNEPRREEIRQKLSKLREHDYTIFLGIQQLLGVEVFKATQHEKVKQFLYTTLGLPIKTDSDGHVTAGEDAVVSLIATVQKKLQDLKTDNARQGWEIKLATLKLLLSIRGYDKLLSSYINIDMSPDNRVRSWYKFWGTETGRWSAGSWHDGTGLNGQTIPRESV